jgi:hypothetical protein
LTDRFPRGQYPEFHLHARGLKETQAAWPNVASSSSFEDFSGKGSRRAGQAASTVVTDRGYSGFRKPGGRGGRRASLPACPSGNGSRRSGRNGFAQGKNTGGHVSAEDPENPRRFPGFPAERKPHGIRGP